MGSVPYAGKAGPVPPGRKRTGWQSVPLLLSACLCAALSLCYGLRPDSGAAVTIVPVWAWAAPGLLLTALGWRRASRRAVAAMAVLWLLYLLAYSEERTSLALLRRWPAPEWQAARRQGRALRVVSLNCGGGLAEAAAEVAPYQPDIVLLQESPSRQEVERLAQRLFSTTNCALYGPDASILARGRLTPAPLPPLMAGSFAQAHVRLTSGIGAHVVSLRLTPAIVRLDFWSPDCWREQAANRRARRAHLRPMAERIAALPPGAPVILGGDFNAPAGDAIFRLLQPRFHDTFPGAGIGWPNTILNDIPLHRIDQVWTSDHFRPAAVLARRTRHSDHRLVVCDLLLRQR